MWCICKRLKWHYSQSRSGHITDICEGSNTGDLIVSVPDHCLSFYFPKGEFSATLYLKASLSFPTGFCVIAGFTPTISPKSCGNNSLVCFSFWATTFIRLLVSVYDMWIWALVCLKRYLSNASIDDCISCAKCCGVAYLSAGMMNLHL